MYPNQNNIQRFLWNDAKSIWQVFQIRLPNSLSPGEKRAVIINIWTNDEYGASRLHGMLHFRVLNRLLFMMLLVQVISPARAQLSGNNLFEYQLGNIPGESPAGLSTHYDQLNLQYRYKALRASVRYEHFLSTEGSRSYSRLTQYNLQYREKGLSLEVGNFNAILGNGLLLRAYEIPGSVFEDQGYRVRYGFYRDLRGFSAKYIWNQGYVKALRGTTLANTLPPTLEEGVRRPDLTEGVETGMHFIGQTVGFVVMRNTNDNSRDLFYALLLNGNISAAMSYNLEFAHNIVPGISPFTLEDASRYGIYGSLNYTLGSFGLSAEYKDYQNLLIGAGISDPPTLVKEHKYRLLNRNIHVPQYINERGTQLEAYYSFGNGSRMLLNYARAVNELNRTFVFNEVFAEYFFYAGNKNTFTLFTDYSSEPIKSEDHRYTGGVTWEYTFRGRHSTQLEVEYQSVERNVTTPDQFSNIAVIAGYSRSPGTTISLTWELSSDSYQTTDTDYRSWLGLNISHKLNAQNTLTIFAGQRRGGPACTSGICYEVLDFQGVEIRLKTKF